MDGFGFCRELRKHKHGADVPLIVTSAIYKDQATIARLQARDRRRVLRQAVPDPRAHRRRCGGSSVESERPRPRPPRAKHRPRMPTVGLARRAAAPPRAAPRAAEQKRDRHAHPSARQGQKGDRARARHAGRGRPPTCAPRRSAISWSRAASSTTRAIGRRSSARRSRRRGSGRCSSSSATSRRRAARSSSARRCAPRSPTCCAGKRATGCSSPGPPPAIAAADAGRGAAHGVRRASAHRARRRDRAGAGAGARPHRADAARRAPSRAVRARVRRQGAGRAAAAAAHRGAARRRPIRRRCMVQLDALFACGMAEIESGAQTSKRPPTEKTDRSRSSGCRWRR